MKILYININMHVKNNNALLNYKNIKFCIINHTNIDSLDLRQFDCVYSPSQPIDVKKYPNTKFIFGPHFSVFPDKNHMDLLTDNKNVIYIQPSDWANNVWKYHPFCKNVRIETLPFGVDTKKFDQIKPINERNYVFVYFKRRHHTELILIQQFLQSHNINAKLFDYVNRYDENEFINYLHESRFGIWLDAHESQGFALEEALSCNVPLLVWNVISMKQEVGSNYENIPATTIPYWDERCGESFIYQQDLPIAFEKFMNDLNNYKPREYILENLSFEKCQEKLIDLIKI